MDADFPRAAFSQASTWVTPMAAATYKTNADTSVREELKSWEFSILVA
jgi:hypothetical protein